MGNQFNGNRICLVSLGGNVSVSLIQSHYLFFCNIFLSWWWYCYLFLCQFSLTSLCSLLCCRTPCGLFGECHEPDFSVCKDSADYTVLYMLSLWMSGISLTCSVSTLPFSLSCAFNFSANYIHHWLYNAEMRLCGIMWLFMSLGNMSYTAVVLMFNCLYKNPYHTIFFHALDKCHWLFVW